MTTSIPRLLAFALLLTSATGAPSAQTHLERPTLYRLERDSTFQRGCFPPCMCPMLETAPIRGTFRLELVNIGDVFDFYDVKGVRLRVQRTNADDVWIRGHGQFKTSAIADLQELTLVLTVGDEPPTTYWSDAVPGGAEFPRIRIPISINGGYCHDTVIELHAQPARRFFVEPDGLAWDASPEPSQRHDVAAGDLGALLASRGNFEAATTACLADGAQGSYVPFGDAPAAGTGFWFLERAEDGSFDDDDAAQLGSSDAGIAASVNACP